MKLSTSSANYADIYLACDSPVLNGSNNAYVVRIGGTSDEVSLFLKKGTVMTKIIDGHDKTVSGTSSNPLKVKVQNLTGHAWSLYADFTGKGNNYKLQGTAIDSSFMGGGGFGILIHYSASNASKFFFDDISVRSFVRDSLAPEIKKIMIISPRQIDVYLSENADSTSACTKENYKLKGASPLLAGVVQDSLNKSLLHIYFAGNFIAGTNTLEIDNISDESGNILVRAACNFFFYEPHFNDIIINEVMADPDPPAGLPEYEYLELYNRKDFSITLHDWTITVGTTVKKIPVFTLAPEGYLVLLSESGAGKYNKSNCLGVSGFPALTNGGAAIILKDNYQHVISELTYSDTWYGDSHKSEGGYSLELIDPENPCSGATNWRASTDVSGGSPGIKNSVASVNPDNVSPEILRVEVMDSVLIEVFFSEAVDTLIGLSSFMIDKDIGYPVEMHFAKGFRSLVLKLGSPLKTGVKYSLKTVDLIRDCAGNIIDEGLDIPFAFAAVPASSDIIINEVLFNPKTGGVDFVEVYNRSGKIINLGELFLACADFNTGRIDSEYKIGEESFTVFPGAYCLLTTRPDIVQQQYFCGSKKAFIGMSRFPVMNIDNGVIILKNRNGLRLDELRYSSSMHFPLLNDVKGVSLERLDPLRPTSDSTNWHSASGLSGFATPAYINSQNYNYKGDSGILSTDVNVFSPDNDGYNDVLQIVVRPAKPGVTGHLSLFDNEGRKIRTLSGNVLMGTENFFSWDGLTDHSEKAGVGIYIIALELFDLEGNFKTYKKNCVLAGRL